MLKIPALALCLLALGNASALAADKTEPEEQLTLTIGAQLSRTGLDGSLKNKAEWSPLLGIDYRNGRFFAGSQGIGYEFVKTDWLSLHAAGAFDPGRKAGTTKESPQLVGMGKVASSALLIVGGSITPLGDLLSLQANYIRSTRSEQGARLILGANLGFPIAGPVSGAISVSATRADSKHAQTFWGVTTAQSASSGNRVYRPKAGWISTDISAGLNWQIDSAWTAGVAVGREQYRGVAASSPLIKRRADTTGTLSLSYTF